MRSNGKEVKINKSICDIYKLLRASNFKAHFIDFNRNLIEQILEILNCYNINNGEEQMLPYKEYYKDIFNIINYCGIGDNFKTLVELRTNKFKMKPDEFIKKEEEIIKKIKEISSKVNIMEFFDE